jgi:hypothetical protein
MKTWQKVGIGVGAAAVLGGIVLFSVHQANKGVVTVQTAKIAPQETRVWTNYGDFDQGRRSREEG